MVSFFLLPDDSGVDSSDRLLGLLVTDDARGDMGGSVPLVLTKLLSLIDFLVPLRGDLEALALLPGGAGESGAVASVRLDEDAENFLAELCRLGFGEVGDSW